MSTRLFSDTGSCNALLVVFSIFTPAAVALGAAEGAEMPKTIELLS